MDERPERRRARRDSTDVSDPGPVTSPTDGAPHPLSQVALGLRVQVDRILFAMPRHACDQLGIREGTFLQPMAWVPGGVVVKLPDGTTTHIDTEIAEFISVCIRSEIAPARPRVIERSDGDSGEDR